MKKLLAKIIGATTALALAIGVGVAVGNNREATMLDADSNGSFDLTCKFTTNKDGTGTVSTQDGGVEIDNSTKFLSTNGSVVSTFSGTKYYYKFTGDASLISASSITGSKFYAGKNNTFKFASSSAAGSFGFSLDDSTYYIRSVEITGYSSKANASITVAEANAATQTQTISSDSDTYTFTYSGTSTRSVSISVPSNKATNVSLIRVNYSITSGGGGDPEPTTFTVTYDANGGSGTMTDSHSPYNADATVTVLTNTFTYSNHTFNSWNTSPDGSGESYDPDDTFTINANTILYAQWTDVTPYTVTYNANGGSGSVTDTNSPYICGTTVTVKDDAGFTAPTGMVFSKWTTNANGTGDEYDPGDTFEISGNTVLYAKWVDDPSISYTTVYSTGFESNESFTAGSNYMSTVTCGASGKQWEAYYGTPSTNSAIAGSQSLQTRWYYNHTEDIPYMKTLFASIEVRRISFKYKASNQNLNFKVQYNTDGGDSWTDIETVDTVDNNEHNYKKIFDTAISAFYLRILTCGSAPDSGNYALVIDSVLFESDATLASINGNSAVDVGTQWSPTSITEDESGDSVTGATYSFTTSGGALISESSTSTGAFTASHDGIVTVSATKSGYLIASKAVTINPVDASIVVPTASTTGFTGQNESIAFTYANIVNSVVVTSNDSSVVTVSSLSCNAGSGTVQFNFVGVGTTTVSFKDGETELDSVSVTVSLSQVSITGLPASKEVFVGRTLDLGSIVTVEAVGNCTDAVTWESEDDDIVMVDDSGTILGIDVGTTNVIVFADDYPSASMTCAVTVSEVPQDAYIVDFGLAKKSDAGSLSNNSDFKTAYSFDDEEEVTFSGFDRVYGETNKMLKLGSNKNAATLTITIPSYSYISYVEMVVGETPNNITLNVTSGVAEAQTESQTLAVGKLTFDDYLASEKSNSITLSSSTAGAFYLENLIIHYVNAKDQVERLNTQTTLSYHYSSNGNGEYEYSNVAIRFGGFMSQDLWGQLDTNAHNIDGYGVLLTTDSWISNDSDVEAAYSLAAENAEITDYYSGNITPTPKSVPSEATAAQKTAHGVEGDYYIWNLYLDIDEADYDTTFVGVAYIKLKNGTVVFMKKASFSVYSLAADYIANRGYNDSTAGGSLGDLASHA